MNGRYKNYSENLVVNDLNNNLKYMNQNSTQFKSHYVPKRHLKRFVNPESSVAQVYTKLIKIIGNNIKIDHQNVKHFDILFSGDHFYDDSDPNNEKSVEKQLEVIEEKYGDALDLMLSSGIFINKIVYEYVSMLEKRSLLNRLLLMDAWNLGTEDDKKLSVKQYHKLLLNTGHILNDYEYDCCKTLIIKCETGSYYTTSDNPVMPIKTDTFLKIPLIKEYFIQKHLSLSVCEHNLIFVCPLSRDYCSVIYHKENNIAEIMFEEISNYDLTFRLFMAAYTIKSLCTPFELSQDELNILRDPNNPNYDLVSIVNSKIS